MDKLINKSTNIASDFEYKKVEDNNNCIYIKTNKREYEIKNREDLINFGLKHAYISFDLLKQYCRLFHEPQFEIRFLLNDRDIKLTSDKINFIVCKASGLDKVAEDKGETDEDGLIKRDIEKKGKRALENNNIYRIVSMSNVSFFRPGDIKNLIIKLCFESKCIFNRDSFIDKYGYADYKKMVYFKIITKKASGIIINPLIFKLINKINDDIEHKGVKHENIKHINDYYNVKTFYIKYGDYVKQLLLENEDVNILIGLIWEANLLGNYSIQEIMRHCIKYNYEELFIKVFIGNKPTNGIKPLKDFSDICFSCNNLGSCIGQDVRGMSDKYISKLLLEYRNRYSKECLNNVVKTKNLVPLLNKTIFAKFLLSYTTVVSIKSLLIHLGIIKKDHILHKNSGKYCPKKDIWRIKI